MNQMAGSIRADQKDVFDQRNKPAASCPANWSVDRSPNTTLAIPGRCIIEAELNAI